MKRIYLFSIITVIFLLTAYLLNADAKKVNEIKGNSESVNYNLSNVLSLAKIKSNEEESKEGPELEREYFKHWHYPYSNVLPLSVQRNIWNDIKSVPDENIDNNMSENGWYCVGPWRQNVTYGTIGRAYTGRILDIEIIAGDSVRIAAASGGVWQVLSNRPMTESITSQATSCIYTDVAHPNEIYVGTGETGLRGGTGLWRTYNGGLNWFSTTMNPNIPATFYRIKYNQRNPNILYAATEGGLYRSTDRGYSWNLNLSGNATDVGINPTNDPVTVYTSLNGDGLYKSTNGGNNWSKVTTPGIPITNVGRTALSISKSNPNIIYVSMARADNNELLGIYKTTNNGLNWENKSPFNYLVQQGWYDNVIAVCPTNPNIVLAGGVDFVRSDNGGNGWSTISRDVLHVDHHAITWKDNGIEVYNANDGGLAYSNDAGLTWSYAFNSFPITQYVNFDIGVNNTNVIAGGSQDNGFSVTVNGGISWSHTLSGDCGGFTIDPNNASRMFGVDGVYTVWFGDPFAFKRKRSTNFGQNWQDINNGIDPNGGGQWYTKIRNDKSNPVYIYNNMGPFVYASSNYGNDWSKMNTTAFGAQVNDVNVSKYNSGLVTIYACMNFNSGSARLKVYDMGAWFDRASGLSENTMVRKVAVHPTSLNVAYALMNGIGSPRIYKTTNKGINWINITGNLGQNIPVADLIPHPTDDNKLYLGTEMGCFKTTNGGQTWIRWNYGMPQANIITEMKYVDSLAIRNKFYIVASTYGRSIWMREIQSDDPPIGIKNSNFPVYYSLYQNYPNPFNPSTTISFSIPKESQVKLTIYDMIGREVNQLTNKFYKAGNYELKWDASDYSSGVYFYTIQTNEFTETKKMMLIK